MTRTEREKLIRLLREYLARLDEQSEEDNNASKDDVKHRVDAGLKRSSLKSSYKIRLDSDLEDYVIDE